MQTTTVVLQPQLASFLGQATRFRIETKQGHVYLTQDGQNIGRVAGIMLDRDDDTMQPWLFAPEFNVPASSYLAKTTVHANVTPVPWRIGHNRAAARHASQNLSVEPLTPRELEVLRLVAAGLSTREIAAELVIAAATVKKHIATIFSKLSVNRRTQAIAVGRDLALL